MFRSFRAVANNRAYRYASRTSADMTKTGKSSINRANHMLSARQPGSLSRIASTCREVLNAATHTQDMNKVKTMTWGRPLRHYLLYRHLEPLLIDTQPRSWLDSGCGLATAIKDYKKDYPEVYCAGLDMRDFALDNLDKKIVGDVRCLTGIDMQFDLITDVYGPASYARNPLDIMNIYLRKLKLNGHICLNTDYSRTQLESLRQIVYDRRGMVVIDDQGNLVNLPEYLREHSSGLEFDWFRLPVEPSEELKIRKTSLNYKLPELVSIKFRLDYPPLNVMIRKEDVPAIEAILKESGINLADENASVSVFPDAARSPVIMEDSQQALPLRQHSMFSQPPVCRQGLWRTPDSFDRKAPHDRHEYTMLNSRGILWVRARPPAGNDLFEFEIIAGRRGCRFYSYDTIDSGISGYEFNARLAVELNRAGIKADTPHVVEYPKAVYIGSIFLVRAPRHAIEAMLPDIYKVIEAIEGRDACDELQLRLKSMFTIPSASRVVSKL